ncbi:hypothetical protein NMG60_11027298 [Bertholletia excelsa]
MSYLVYTLLCLSLHACTARHLGVLDKDETGKGIHLLAKGVEKEKLHQTFIPSIVSHSMAQVKPTQEVIGRKEEAVDSRGGRATYLKQTTKETLEKEKEDTKGLSNLTNIIILFLYAILIVVRLPSTERAASSSQELLQQPPNREERDRQARKILGSMEEDAEEAVDAMEKEGVEDVVVMDYAQPQRKPPIHNK